MFTGIVTELGRVIAPPAASGRGGMRLELGHGAALSARLSVGDSLAVNGVCLTAVELGDGTTAVELAPETLERSTLGSLRAGEAVNLEPPLRVGDPLGGHCVQGHVDGTVAIRRREDSGEHRVLELELPAALARYVAEKGSVALDGVSLTVAAQAAESFSVALLPHTLEVTTLGLRQVGDRVNLEVDVLAKYVERLLGARCPP